ncbi:MAG: tetratricopeptide repeat protein, partial [Cyanobacteriota bacterium]
NDTLESNLEEPARIYLSSQDKLVKSPIPDERPNLKPQIPPESFYTPILKPIIKEAFAVTSESNFVTINIYAKPDEDDNLLKDKAYEIMRRIMGVNPSLGKIVINWQPEQGGFGKSASLAGIYIKDFFSKKITRNELKEVIFTAAIEPESRHLNEVMDIAKVEVPIDNLRKGKELRTAANIYRQNKKYDSAIRTYEQAIQFNPNDFLSYYWIGEVYAELKEFDKAKVSLSKALGLNPDFRQADESLARIKSGDCNK